METDFKQEWKSICNFRRFVLHEWCNDLSDDLRISFEPQHLDFSSGECTRFAFQRNSRDMLTDETWTNLTWLLVAVVNPLA